MLLLGVRFPATSSINIATRRCVGEIARPRRVVRCLCLKVSGLATGRSARYEAVPARGHNILNSPLAGFASAAAFARRVAHARLARSTAAKWFDAAAVSPDLSGEAGWTVAASSFFVASRAAAAAIARRVRVALGGAASAGSGVIN
jgi:hypothetical protein